MALSANTVWEVRTAGADTNGAGFVTGAAGTDFSQQDLKNTVGSNISTTDAVAVGTGVITSVTAAFTAAIVGNIIYLQGGTGALAAGWYQVTVFTNATTITVDRNVAAGTGITMNIGGAMASLGMVGASVIAGHIIHIKAGTYSITSATPNISGGCFSAVGSPVILWGYQAVRGDFGTQPLLQAAGIATFTVIANTGADSSVANIDVDCASLASSRAFQIRGFAFRCNAFNCTNSGFVQSSTAFFARCTASGCSTTAAFLNGSMINCVAYNNTVVGFSLTNAGLSAIRCIADSNTGATSDGFITSGEATFVNCVAYANGRDGFRIDEDASNITNCIAESNVGIGINLNGNPDSVLVANNATFGNGTGVSLGTGKGVISLNNITGTSTFFIDAANQNFALNKVSGGGASAKRAGYPGVLPVGGTGYIDIGALQSLGTGTPYVIDG